MKERLDTLVALAESLSGQAKDMRERAEKIVAEEEKIRRSIAAEKCRPLRVGSVIAKVAPACYESFNVRVYLVTGFKLTDSREVSKSTPYVETVWAEYDRYGKHQKRTESFSFPGLRYVILDPREAREMLGFPLSLETNGADDDEVDS